MSDNEIWVQRVQNLHGDFTVGFDDRLDTLSSPDFCHVDVKKPYLINPNQIECVVGEWDKDKTTYGIRIFFASGNSVWCGGAPARNLLAQLAISSGQKEILTSRFDSASKR